MGSHRPVWSGQITAEKHNWSTVMRLLTFNGEIFTVQIIESVYIEMANNSTKIIKQLLKFRKFVNTEPKVLTRA